jgi:ankyrin repeat protein
MHLALENQRFDLALHLVSVLSPALISLQNNQQETPLHLATKKGSVIVIHALIDKCPMDVFCRDKLGNNPIFYAQSKEALDLLLKCGAQINEKNDAGLTPLLYQIQTTKNQLDPELIDAFLAQPNLDLNAQDQGHRTLLHFCAFKGFLSLCERIIKEKKINLNAVSRRGNTCLHAAAEVGHLELVRLFLGEGADPTIRNVQGRTPADVCQVDEVKSLLHGMHFYQIEIH